VFSGVVKCAGNEDMKGKVVAITGATSGIGQAAAENMASMGARIVQLARDLERGKEALKRLRERTPDVSHSIYYADLSRISETKQVAAQIVEAEPRIDVLVNNAGAMFGSRQLTADGLERTFALNHMAYFVLTHDLWERLVVSGGARVVNTASDAHQAVTLDFDDLQSAKAYRGRHYGDAALWRPWFQGLWPLEVVQHSFHTRTCPAACRRGGYCKLLPSGLRRDSFR